MDNQSTARSSSSVPAPNAGQHLDYISVLPTELLDKITQYLTIEPDVTTEDETVQRKQASRLLCLVSSTLRESAARALYKVIDIQTFDRLQKLYKTFKSHPERGQLVCKLFINIAICWRGASEDTRQEKCGYLYKVLERTTSLQLLSLDLDECTGCFRNIIREDYAADGATDGYEAFYQRVAGRIRKELKVKAELRTFLPKIKEFRFTSNDIPYDHRAFFALKTLRCIVSLRDTGAWSMILGSGYDNGIQYPHINILSLRSSALISADFGAIGRSFPKLEELRARNNPQETNRQSSPVGVTPAALEEESLSEALAEMRLLKLLYLQLDYSKAPARPQINFPLQLGPAGGITSLRGLRNLTRLQIGMHQLMCYRGTNSQPKAEPLPPLVLPPALKHLRLYTCLSCWDNSIARLSRDESQQTFPSYAGESTLWFIGNLATYVTAGDKLPGLETVRLFSQTAWWLAYGAECREVRHCKKEEGQTWQAGGFQELCQISRFEDREIHFRAYETDELDCGRDHPYDKTTGACSSSGA